MPDHPRSRGVYAQVLQEDETRRGSSPLARGLLRRRHEDAYAVRIIPARAGFTFGFESFQSSVRDHPRSRGVYLTAHKLTLAFSGSSPLARGLQKYYGPNAMWGGIIPARAGFTVRPRP